MLSLRIYRRTIFFFLLLSLSAASVAQAADHYIRAGATGSGDGSSWTNACAGFSGSCAPSSMVRGDTYWVAAGSYGGVDFTTPDSGTSVITIEGATISSHGPASDWSNSYAGQALFGPSSASTDYWTFNGQAGVGCTYPSNNSPACYSIKFWNQADGGGQAFYIGGNNHLNFIYIEMEGTGQGFPNNNSTADKCSSDNCGVWADYALFEGSPVSNLYVGYGYYHHTGNTQFQMNDTGSGGSVNNTVTWEYNWVSYNHTGQNGQHDEAYSLLANNVTIRYNIFQDISGSGLICDASAANPSMSNWYVYGNLFFNDPAYLALGPVYWLNSMDNGILALGDGNGSPENLTGTFLFSNNTIANFDPPGVAGYNVYSTLPISGVPGGITGTANVIIENNLWYASAFVYGNYNPICTLLSGTCAQDYNASYQGNSAIAAGNWQTNSTPGAHDYNVSGTISPFSGSQPAATIAGYELTTPDPFASHAGIALGSPYNLDMLGVTRGANGTWDRGALQISGSGTPPPPPPTSIPCDVNQDGVVNVLDVQLEVNLALGITTPCPNADGCTVVQVQRVVNAALGGTCVNP